MDLRIDIFEPNSIILVAVSGGLDSVVLLNLLVQQKVAAKLIVAHFDHQLRATSGLDSDFVESLAKKYHLEFVLGTANVAKYAEVNKLSLEDAARKLRYSFLQKEAANHNCAYVVTAHNQNDQVETIVMRFLRGGGSKGLSGMALQRKLGLVNLVRPLLNVTRAEIEKYAKIHKLQKREDETNLNTDILRNKLRHEVIPALVQINPNLSETLVRMADILRADEAELEKIASEVYQEVLLEHSAKIRIDNRSLKQRPLAIQRRVVRKAIENLVGDLDTISLGYIDNFLENNLNTLYLDDKGDLRGSKS